MCLIRKVIFMTLLAQYVNCSPISALLLPL